MIQLFIIIEMQFISIVDIGLIFIIKYKMIKSKTYCSFYRNDYSLTKNFNLC